MGELSAIISGLVEGIVTCFGAFGEPALWVKHYCIYFLGGVFICWLIAFASVRLLNLFKRRKPELAVWFAWLLGFAIVGTITAALSLVIAFFSKQEGSSPVYALGYGILVLLCFLGIYLLSEKVEKSYEDIEVMLRSGIEL